MVQATQPPARSHDEPQPRRSRERAELLNGLIALNRDAQAGFDKAAELAESTTLAALFERAARERAAFARALRPLVKEAGGEPGNDGTLDGAVHRLWMEIHQRLSGHGDRTLIDEAERAEDDMVLAYREALAVDLPRPVHAVLDIQAERIFAVHDMLSDLKHGRSDN